MLVRGNLLARAICVLVALAAVLAIVGGSDTARATAPTTFVASSITAGFIHNCGLVDESDSAFAQIKCWGDNTGGQVAIGTSGNMNTAPADICSTSSGTIETGTTKRWKCGTPLRPGLDISFSVGSGIHTCVISDPGASGTAQCWGLNNEGQLGDGQACGSPSCTVPVNVCDVGASVPCGSDVLTGIVSIAVGYEHSCAYMYNGGIECWGENNFGQLGDGTTTSRSTPVDVCQTYNSGTHQCDAVFSGASSVGAGYVHTCAVKDATARCWGRNSSGQLGDGTTTDRLTPITVSLSNVTAVAGGGYDGVYPRSQTCALVQVTSNNAMYCWGNNTYGQLGDSTNTNRTSPVAVSGLSSGVTALGLGGLHSCALNSSGGIKCWGYNNYGELGDGTNTTRNSPVDVSGLTSGAASVAGGYFHSCTRLSGTGDTTIKCWGHNGFAELGNGKTTDSNVPSTVQLDSDRDGCTNAKEDAIGSNYQNFWDIFDTPTSSNIRDRKVDQSDYDRINARYYANDSGGSATINRNTDPLSAPPGSGYHPAFDRSSVGSGKFDLGPADGSINISDLLLVNRQKAQVDCSS